MVKAVYIEIHVVCILPLSVCQERQGWMDSFGWLWMMFQWLSLSYVILSNIIIAFVTSHIHYTIRACLDTGFFFARPFSALAFQNLVSNKADSHGFWDRVTVCHNDQIGIK